MRKGTRTVFRPCKCGCGEVVPPQFEASTGYVSGYKPYIRGHGPRAAGKRHMERVRSLSPRELLSYDPETGDFHWLQRSSNRVKAGDAAGKVNKQTGYVMIGVGGKRYMAHRLAWFFTHGRWPAADIDHINMCRSDNRLANLREATRTQNNANRPAPPKNKSGYKGVYFASRERKWFACATKEGRRYVFGRFNDPAEAYEAYKKGVLALYGAYARLS